MDDVTSICISLSCCSSLSVSVCFRPTLFDCFGCIFDLEDATVRGKGRNTVIVTGTGSTHYGEEIEKGEEKRKGGRKEGG